MTKSINEIARMANVSVTTVRLVINDQHKKYRISEQTRKRIQDIIDKHGYYINQTARSLKLNKSQTLGLVVPRITNAFFAALTEELEWLCRNKGFQLITICSDENADIERKITENLYARGVDGMFVCSTNHSCQQELHNNQWAKPVVFIDRDFDIPDIPMVRSDHYQGAFQLGHNLANVDEIFFLAGNINLPSMEARLKGMREGIASAGRELNDNHIFIADKGRHVDGYDLMKHVLEHYHLDAQTIVMASLPVLEGAIECMKHVTGTIPKGLTIACFDDHAMLDFLPNEVIAVKQDTMALATNASELMNSLLDKKNGFLHRHILEPEMITRTRVLS